jgi:hypothetical protein
MGKCTCERLLKHELPPFGGVRRDTKCPEHGVLRIARALNVLQAERWRLKEHIKTVQRNMDQIMANIPLDLERRELMEVETALAILAAEEADDESP